jgi:hypothetical protein
MNDKFFVDTGLFVYAYDDSVGNKHAAVLKLFHQLFQSGLGIISFYCSSPNSLMSAGPSASGVAARP